MKFDIDWWWNVKQLYDIDRPDIKDAKFSLVCRYEAESDSPSGKARDLSFVNMCLWLAKRTSLSFSFVFYLSEESAKTRRMIFSKYPPFSSSITESPSYTEDEVNLAKNCILRSARSLRINRCTALLFHFTLLFNRILPRPDTHWSGLGENHYLPRLNPLPNRTRHSAILQNQKDALCEGTVK